MRKSKRHYCTGFLEVVFLCVLCLWDMIKPHRLNVNHRAAVWQDVRPAEEMSVCSVHYSHVGCGTGLAAKWHQTPPLTSFILCRCILCWATFKHSVCVGVFRCEFVCTCMNKYACVWPIVSHSDCPEAATKEFRFLWQSKKNCRSQTFHFRITWTAWSLIWWSCLLHPLGWLDTGIHKPGMFPSTASLYQRGGWKWVCYSKKSLMLLISYYLFLVIKKGSERKDKEHSYLHINLIHTN